MRKDLDSNEDVINVLCQASPVLVANASQDDKVDVHKQLTDITEQWDGIENAWSKRKSELEQTYEIAVQYQNELASIENWLTEEEKRFAEMPGVGSNAADVKKQLAEMRVTDNSLIDTPVNVRFVCCLLDALTIDFLHRYRGHFQYLHRMRSWK